MRRRLASIRLLRFHRTEVARVLQPHLEELLIEVGRQEAFERKHPFTGAVIREASSSLMVSRSR